MSKSRAAIISIIFLFAVCIGLTTSAPLPERLSSLAERDYDNDFVARSFDELLGRDFDIPVYDEYSKRAYLSSILKDRDFDLEYTPREYEAFSALDERDFDDVEFFYAKRDNTEMLRRRSIFDSIRHAFQKAGNAIRGGFSKVQSSFQRVGGTIRNGFQKAGGVMRNGFQKAGGAMRSGFQRVGGAMRSGFQKVGNGFKAVGTYFKKSGAMIGKFALKVVAATASVASRVVKFVPGVGSLLSKALKGVAMGANEGAKQIHASLPGNLEKASEGMDYVISPTSALAKVAGGDKARKALDVLDNIL